MDTESRIITGDEAKERVWDLIRSTKFALMASYDEKAKNLKARPMMALNLHDFDGTLWFFTSSNSSKTNQLRANSLSLLTYAEPSRQDYVYISGWATVVRDQASEAQASSWTSARRESLKNACCAT